jgi:hypothetical protein
MHRLAINRLSAGRVNPHNQIQAVDEPMTLVIWIRLLMHFVTGTPQGKLSLQDIWTKRLF